MKCPFELPVRAKYSEISDAYIVVDPHDKIVAYHCNDESSVYIVQAINSHEKLVEAIRKGMQQIELSCGHTAYSILEQALKEAEKPK